MEAELIDDGDVAVIVGLPADVNTHVQAITLYMMSEQVNDASRKAILDYLAYGICKHCGKLDGRCQCNNDE